MKESRVLVVGATRNREKLAQFAPHAELAPVDLRDVPKLTEACRGVDQIVATANNNMGTGENSPARVDLTAYQNLCAAARNAGAERGR